MNIKFSKDIHKLQHKKTKNLILGGIEIDNSKYSIKAHSDGDLIIHTIISAILSTLNLKTIGEYFNDEDKKYKNCSSVELLKNVLKFEKAKNLIIESIDLTIICEKIILKDYLKKIQKNLQKILKVNNITLKATRFENKWSRMIECYCILLSK